MHHTMVANMQKSDRKKQSQEVKTSLTPQYVQPCRGCGKYLHPNGSMNRKDCPAAKMTFFNCGIFGHMEKVCQKPKGGSANRLATSEAKEESFAIRRYMKQPRRRNDQSGRVNWRGKANATWPKAIPHLVWNGDKFQRGFLDPPPILTVTVIPMPEAHAEFRHTLIKANKFVPTVSLPLLTQEPKPALVVWKYKRPLGTQMSTWYPLPTKFWGITEEPLDIEGVMFAGIRAGSKETCQTIYMSKNTSRFYLYESALKKLGLLPSDFPTLTSQQNAAISNEGKALCGCPQKTIVLPKLIDFPFELTEENRCRLEEWVLEHFRASAFNTCPHQQLQTMKGKYSIDSYGGLH